MVKIMDNSMIGYFGAFTMWMYSIQIGSEEDDEYDALNSQFKGENLPTTLFFFSATQVNE